jgi:carbamoyltransferase
MEKIIRVVGFQPGHDVSYCILENGIPVVHEELERFTREKEPLGDGLEMFFKHNPDVNDVKYFCHGNPSGRFGRWASKCGKPEYFEKMQNMIDKNNGKYYVIGHHQSHAAGAFYSSNFKDALVITLDGGGTDKIDVNDYNESTANTKFDTGFTVWEGKDTKIERKGMLGIHEFSIGFLWHKVTSRIFELSVGHPKGNQAGTVMAMGTAGNPDKYFDVFYDKIVAEPQINWKFYNELVKKDEHTAFDIAAGLQKATETRFKEIITPYIEQYSGNNLCFSGGVSLNSVMIGKIFDWFPQIKNIHCDPVPYDGGCSLGSARYVWHHILGNPRIKWEDNSSPYLGRTYSLDDINTDINKFIEVEEV